MDFDEERAGVVQLVEVTSEQHGFKFRRRVQIAWHPKLIDALAMAQSRGRWSAGLSELEHQIVLSQPIWPTLDANERYITVLHELAHLVTAETYGPTAAAERDGHGPLWATQMRRLGLRPDPCHQGLWGMQGKCACRIRIVQPPQVNIVILKIRAGGKYRCNECKQVIKFEVPR